MDGWRLLTTTDPHEAATLNVLIEQAGKVREELAEMEAAHIANAVGKMLSGER